MTEKTLATAERATKTLRALAAEGPNMFSKNNAAMIWVLPRMSSFGTAAK